MERGTIVNLIIASTLFIAIAALLLLNPGMKECSTSSCILESAKTCSAAKGTIEQSGLTLLVTSSTECFINAEVVSVSADEIAAIRDLFIGRAMRCEAADYTDILALSDLSSCSGSLKDALYELALIQLESS